MQQNYVLHMTEYLPTKVNEMMAWNKLSYDKNKTQIRWSEHDEIKLDVDGTKISPTPSVLSTKTTNDINNDAGIKNNHRKSCFMENNPSK